MLKRTFASIAACALMIGCGQSMDQLGGKNSSMLANGDNDFFKTITISNETEIQTSQLALTQSQNQAVKDFAQHMIADHHAAEDKVSGVATAKGVVLPMHVDDSHRTMIDDLKGKSGTDFDKAYAELQVKAHEDTISADEDEANNGTDSDVKALANQLLPTLQMHLQMARQLQSGMGAM